MMTIQLQIYALQLTNIFNRAKIFEYVYSPLRQKYKYRI